MPDLWPPLGEFMPGDIVTELVSAEADTRQEAASMAEMGKIVVPVDIEVSLTDQTGHPNAVECPDCYAIVRAVNLEAHRATH